MGKTLRFVLALGACIASLAWLARELTRYEPPPRLACEDARPGLWLAIDGARFRLTGAAPLGAARLAVIVAVDHWGYPSQHVCDTRATDAGRFEDLAAAAYRTPFNRIRQGTVLLRDDLVVVTGTVRRRADRETVDGELRANLRAAGFGSVPVLLELGVAVDPTLAPQAAALRLGFASGSATLTPEERIAVYALARRLEENDGRIIVEGYTDSRGRKTFNERLALRRAEAVSDVLAQAHVARSRIEVAGKGARDPIGDNRSAAGRAANRRATIRFEPG